MKFFLNRLFSELHSWYKFLKQPTNTRAGFLDHEQDTTNVRKGRLRLRKVNTGISNKTLQYSRSSALTYINYLWNV